MERCWKCGGDVPQPDMNRYKYDYVLCQGCGQIHFVRKPAEWETWANGDGEQE